MNQTSPRIRGVRVDVLDLPTLEEIVERAYVTRTATTVCFVNVHLIEMARNQPEVARSLAKMDIALPDGAPVAWLLSKESGSAVQRVTGSDFFAHFALRPGAVGRHFFFGSRPEVVAEMERRVPAVNPAATVVGALSPPFDDSATKASLFVETIERAAPDFLWVGLGAPKQERWVLDIAQHVSVPVIAAVGAVFEFVAGSRRRAPAAIQRLGLEWAFRLAQEPRRLSGRYLTTNTSFVAGVLAEAAAKRTRR